MPKNISGSSQQTGLDLTAEVPVANDISSAARFEETIQALLNNDATLQGRLTGAYIRGLLVGAGLIQGGNIQNGAVNAQKLAATGGNVGEYLRLEASNGLSWETPINVQTGAGLTGGGNEGTVTISVPANGIVASMLGANAVTTGKIANDAVTNDKVADDAVDTDQIANDAVDTDQIADGAVETNQLGTGAVTNVKISDGTIAESKLDIHNAPADGQVLEYDTTNGMQWATAASGGSAPQVVSWTPTTQTGTTTGVNFGSTVSHAYRIGDLVFLSWEGYVNRTGAWQGLTVRFNFPYLKSGTTPADDQFFASGAVGGGQASHVLSRVERESGSTFITLAVMKPDNAAGGVRVYFAGHYWAG